MYVIVGVYEHDFVIMLVYQSFLSVFISRSLISVCWQANKSDERENDFILNSKITVISWKSFAP